MRRGLPLAVTTLVILAAPAGAAAAATIETTGSATLTVPNDTASFDASLTAHRATPVAALDAAGAATRKLIAAIEADGVAPKDIATSALTVSPESKKVHHKRVHFFVSNSDLTVTVRNIANVGRVLQDAAGAGATSLNGPNFYLANQDAIYDQALQAALAQAKAKAAALAAVGGLTLGPPTIITESGAEPTPVVTNSAGSSAPAPAPPKLAPPPTSPGTTDVTAQIDVTFSAS
jgi:uncharacterized protein YggE